MDGYQSVQDLVNTIQNVQSDSSTGPSIVVVLVFVFLFLVICGIITAEIARYNERKTLLAYLAGFFLGPLAIVAYMIMGETIELRVYLEQKALREIDRKKYQR